MAAKSKMERLADRAGATVRQSIGQDRPASIPITPAASNAEHEGVKRSERLYRDIEVGRLMGDPSQPRKTFEDSELDELAGSLAARGQLQPAKVYWSAEHGRHVLVYGEKRLRAAVRGGLDSLHCEILPGKPDESVILLEQLTENGHRSAVPAVEEAEAYRRLMALRGWSTRDLAVELKVSQATVVKRLALADLPAPIRTLIDEGRLSQSTAYEITRAPEDVREDLATSAVADGLTRDLVRAEVDGIIARRNLPPDDPARFAANQADTDGSARSIEPPDPSRAARTAGDKPDDGGDDLPEGDPAAALAASEGGPEPVETPPSPPTSTRPAIDEGIPRKPSTLPSPKEVAGWIMHRDGRDIEALYDLGDHQAVNVYLGGGAGWGRVVEALSQALAKAKFRQLLDEVADGPAVPGDRVRMDKPGHFRNGKTGVLLDEYDPAGFLIVRWGDDKREPCGVRYLTKVAR